MGRKKLLTVLVCDDHPLVRDGLFGLLKQMSGFEVVFHEASNGEEAIRLISNLKINLVFMDIHMKGMGGIETCRRIREQQGGAIPIIALTMSDDTPNIMQMVEAGASAYILKNADQQEIHNAVHCVLQGKKYFSGDIALKFINRKKNPTRPNDQKHIRTPSGEVITKRELMVLQEISEEYTNEQIAKHLGISKRTVEMHRQRLLEKFNVRNTAGLIRAAFQGNFLT